MPKGSRHLVNKYGSFPPARVWGRLACRLKRSTFYNNSNKQRILSGSTSFMKGPRRKRFVTQIGQALNKSV